MNNTTNITSQIKVTNDADILNMPEYQKILSRIQGLYNSNILQNFAGNCIAACDLFSVMLSQDGIENQIVECQTSIRWSENGETFFHFVGLDNVAYPGEIDTHTVIITKTKIPLIIDLSISHHLPDTHQYIVEKLNSYDPNILGNYLYNDNLSITYQTKRVIRLPSIHQKSIKQRLTEEKKISEKIKIFTAIVYVSITLGVFNLFLNILLIYLKLLFNV